jgi:hypothetical protein
MSLFATTNVPCPACGQQVSFNMVNSVNAVGRPDLREAILKGTFQKQACPSCQKTFRMDPRFNYLDVKRNQWIAVFPHTDLDQWRTREEEVQHLFDRAFGRQAAPLAREIGVALKPRLVFGWPALWEKLALDDHRLDDVQVELLKVGLLRSLPESPFGLTTELRFQGVPKNNPAELSFAWLNTLTADFVQGVSVPRALYDDVALRADEWKSLRAEFNQALFLDMNRLIVPARI